MHIPMPLETPQTIGSLHSRKQSSLLTIFCYVYLLLCMFLNLMRSSEHRALLYQLDELYTP